MRLLLVIFFAVTACHAQTAPLELKGVVLGTTSGGEISKRWPGANVFGSTILVRPGAIADKACGSNVANESVRSCREPIIESLRLAGRSAGSYAFFLIDGIVERAAIDFNIIGYDVVAGALEQKYGVPTSKYIESKRTRLGGVFDSVTRKWDRPDGTIQLDQRGSVIDESQLDIMSRKYIDATNVDAQRQKTEGAKKL